MVVARIRALLRGIDDLRLSEETIIMVINQCLRSYIEKQKRRVTDRTVDREIVTLTPTGIDLDYEINGLDGEAEVTGLSFSGTVNDNVSVNGDVTLMPLSAFTAHVNDNRIIGSKYGSGRLRLNLASNDVANLEWVATFRDSLLKSVQLGQKAPFPTAHLPLLEHEAAARLMPLADDDSEEWVAWCDRTLKLWSPLIADMRKDFMDYVMSDDSPQIQPAVRSDRHRQRISRTRAYVPPS